MAQLILNHDVVNNPFLRQHIAEQANEIETELPDGAPLSIHIKKVSNHLFAAHLRVRTLKREFVARAYDSNIFQALNRARRHLFRQVDETRQMKRAAARQRHMPRG